MNFGLQTQFAKDTRRAVDLITRSDTSRTALPNRVLYDLVAEFDGVSGTEFHFDITLNGSLDSAARDLALHFDSADRLNAQRGGAFFDIVNRHLRETGHADFKPTMPGWPAP